MNENIVFASVILLGLVALATVIGGIWLASTGGTLPGEVIAIGAGAAGAIGGAVAMKGQA